MPGPIAACAKSTGAMLPRCRWASATGRLCLERGEKLAACRSGRIRGAPAADEDDAGGEGVGALGKNPPCTVSFHSHVPVRAKPAKMTASRKVSQPLLKV